MPETLLIDCAWTKPDAQAVLDAGYSGVIGYLSHDPSKDLTREQARRYTKAGLGVLLVWETTATEATTGTAAGRAHREEAERRLTAMGCPASVPVFYACDEQVDPAAVEAYYRGIHEGATRPHGPYGEQALVEHCVTHGLSTHTWQTEAWSGTTVSRHADLYQRVAKTRPPIRGVKGSAYDENVLLDPALPMWGRTHPAAEHPAGATAAPAAVVPPATGFAEPVEAALRLVVERAPHRRSPLDAEADRLAAAAEAALRRMRSLR